MSEIPRYLIEHIARIMEIHSLWYCWASLKEESDAAPFRKRAFAFFVAYQEYKYKNRDLSPLSLR